ncbi:DEAD/DEAH box helicase [Streptomyces orinoci]|uniref:DEAD/DEAH box helicase n=1 Tax=Streptomyces orinoci TaxID=67339 RepID=A0ABV3K887_STRON|nr:DEAD/DEAH box helicase [Streptomyces orinoci]
MTAEPHGRHPGHQAPDAERWHAALKSACARRSYPEEHTAEAVRRAAEGRLSLRDLRLMLLAVPDHPARQAAFDQVAAHGDAAGQLLLLHAQLESWPPPVVTDDGAEEGREHRASALAGPPGRPVRGPECRADTRKAARQRAQLALLCQLAGLTPRQAAPDATPLRAARALEPGMTGAEFETLLRERAESGQGPGEELLEEILRRASASRLRHRDLELLLFHTGGPPWAAARAAALELVARMPPTAETLLSWHCEQSGGPGAEYRQETGGTPAEPKYTVTARLGPHTGGPRQALGRKVARHYAAVELLARVTGLEPPRVTVPDRPENEKRVAPLKAGDDPLKLLNKYTQLEVITKPVYTFSRGRPGSQAPVICTAACDYRGRRTEVSAQGRAASRAEARIAAARALIGVLSRTGGDMAPVPAIPERRKPPATPAPATPTPPAPAAAGASADQALEALRAGCALVFLPAPAPSHARLLIHRPDGSPLPAPPLPGPLTPARRQLALERPEGIRCAQVEGWALPLDHAVPLLLSADGQAAVHPTVRAWARAARTGLRLIAARLVHPALTPAGLDTWRIGPLPEETHRTLDQLAAQLPPHAHCTPAGSPPHLPPPGRTLQEFLDALADALLRTPGAVPLFGDLPFTGTTARPAPQLRLWTDMVADRCEGGTTPGLVLRVAPPDPADAEAGRLRATLLLRPPGSDRAEPVARFHTGHRPPPGLDHGDLRRAVRALRRAAQDWPPLKRLADHDPAAPLLLTSSDILELLGETGRLLAERGLGIQWPEELRRALSTRTVVGGTAHDGSDGSRGSGESGGPGASVGFGLNQLLDFRWQLVLDGEPLTEAEMDRLVAAARPLVALRDRWVLVDPDTARRARHRRLEPLTGAAALTAALSGSVTVDGRDFACEPAGALAEVVATLRGGETARPVPVPRALHAQLRDYQHRALNWLSHTTSLGFGACLADDMGLGKTLTAIAFHLHRRECGHPGPTLVICPSSLVANWAREIARFAPGTPVIRYHGNQRSLAGTAETAVVVTTYGILRRDHRRLAAVNWDLVLADEAQHVKNHRTQTARCLRELRSGVRLALTGTPVENTLDELWAILDWANPGLFGTLARFRERYARDVERDTADPAARRLTRLISPFLLRRRKSDPGIAPELPPKVHQERIVQLTAEQAALYEANVREAMAAVRGSAGPGRRRMVLRLLTALKQICNHPAHYLHHRTGRPAPDEPPFAERSAKLRALQELLTTIGERGESALIFTSYVVMGRLLQDHLDTLGLDPLFLHGSTPPARRQEMVDAFQAGRHRILILSLRAAGTGLNLTRATHVIHYDRTWNPAIEDQATDRAHRIGQHRTVHVHQLISEGTVEDRIAALLESKRALHDAVLATGESALGALTDRELADLVTLGKNT